MAQEQIKSILQQSPGSEEPVIFDDKYELLSTLGRGRSSVVYLARFLTPPSSSSSEYASLKVLTGDLSRLKAHKLRLGREALALSKLKHPNIIHFNEYVEREDLYYLSVSYAERGDLRTVLESSSSPLEEGLALQLLRQLLCGLSEVHRLGMIHRDIKPENLFITADGTLKIGDFGIVVFPNELNALEASERSSGTLDYLAPEALKENLLGPSADLYATGITAYQLLSKRLPFAGNTLVELVEEKIAGRRVPLPSLNPNISLELDAIIGRALDRQARRRYTSAAEFATALERYVARQKTKKQSSKIKAQLSHRKNKLFSRLASQSTKNPLLRAAIVLTSFFLICLGLEKPSHSIGISQQQSISSSVNKK